MAYLQRFKRCEQGSPTVEFVVIFPFYMFFILSAVEYSLVTMQQAMLENAVDRTVRDIRLGTGTVLQHDDIKDRICDRAGIIRSCGESLRLEMIVQDAFAGIHLPEEPDCTDLSEEAKPVRDFSNGTENQLMILRACAKIDPLFPTSTMGRTLANDGGQIRLTALSAFVQEP
ncbi:TadE/TadG family type IV pilus assembly protein [Ruegeria arenilitoris]|uniref:TadE/TadG family type IV pilus assembly protein n=1 Tax=Ruegeria arenilitoris TaxID=1173585 RepID=UPI0020C3F5E6|nr:TadE family protein [Ruegeria arenilitoris]